MDRTKVVSSKSEVVCKISIFKGLNSIATIQNFQLDVSFDSRYEILIFRIRQKDIINQILMFQVSLKSGLFCTRHIQLKFEIELSNYRAIFNSFIIKIKYLYSNDDVYKYIRRILFKINFTSILFKIIYFKYSKFAKIAKIKILNCPRFSGCYTGNSKYPEYENANQFKILFWQF